MKEIVSLLVEKDLIVMAMVSVSRGGFGLRRRVNFDSCQLTVTKHLLSYPPEKTGRCAAGRVQCPVAVSIGTKGAIG